MRRPCLVAFRAPQFRADAGVGTGFASDRGL